MRARVKSAIFLALFVSAGGALAQDRAPQSPESTRDDLDVTMQIIVDPDAKLPDEVVRRIPLPARKLADPSEQSAGNKPEKPDAADAKERAQELGREMADSAKQRAQEAAEQREQARRSAAEERRRDPGPPTDPPRGPPPRQ